MKDRTTVCASRVLLWSLAALASSLFLSTAEAHGVAEADAQFLERISGVHLLPFMYLGAKHMVTGYDHLLFLAGVIFFLYRLKDVGLYVTLFAIGHSTTLLVGVLAGIRADAYIVDAIIRPLGGLQGIRESRRIPPPRPPN